MHTTQQTLTRAEFPNRHADTMKVQSKRPIVWYSSSSSAEKEKSLKYIRVVDHCK